MNGFNFTERVRKVLAMAREEAARLHHEYVGTEHILLALAREGEGVAAEVLRSFGVDPDDVRAHIDKVVRAGRSERWPGPDLPYTSRAKMVLELSMKEASSMGHGYVGTEHLLLGLVAEGKGIAAQVLADAGIALDATRAEVLRMLGTMAPQSDARPIGEEELESLRGEFDRVELILHYRGGRSFRRTFGSPRDAFDLLVRVWPRDGG
jgi:ATP-dependent Clp protease ATP-binding subunit ClpC